MAISLEKARLNIALTITRAMGTDLKAWKMLREFDAFDTDGSLNIVAAQSTESAVLTAHRMQATGLDSVVLAIEDGKNIRFRQFDAIKSSQLPSGTPRHDLQGGMTVAKWLDLVDENPNVGFTAEGTEFKPDINRVGSLTNA